MQKILSKYSLLKGILYISACTACNLWELLQFFTAVSTAFDRSKVYTMAPVLSAISVNLPEPHPASRIRFPGIFSSHPVSLKKRSLEIVVPFLPV